MARTNAILAVIWIMALLLFWRPWDGGDYMSKTTWIASVARSVCVVALFMGALPAYADTITGAYTVGGTAVQGGQFQHHG